MVDDEAFDKLLETAKRLLFCSVELDDFITNETADAEKKRVQSGGGGEGDLVQQYSNNCKYWIAVSSRANIVIEKVCFRKKDTIGYKKFRLGIL